MHRKQIFASLAGLLVIPLVAGSNGGNVNVAASSGKGFQQDNPNGNTFSLDSGSEPPQDQEGSGNCANFPRAVPLGMGPDDSDYGRPVINLKIGGRSYRMAISLHTRHTYIFASGLCDELGRILVGNPDIPPQGSCYDGISPHILKDPADDQPDKMTIGREIFSVGHSQHSASKVSIGFDLDPSSQSDSSVRTGGGSPPFRGQLDLGDNYPLVVVENLIEYIEVGGAVATNLSPAKEAKFVERLQNVHGVIGLASGSTLLSRVFNACGSENSAASKKILGFGIHIKSGQSIVFGGYDEQGNNFKDKLDLLSPDKPQSFTMKVAGLTTSDGLKIVFDPTLEYNIVPPRLFANLNSTGRESNVNLEVGGTGFTFPVSVIVERGKPSQYINEENQNILVLGEPFFDHAYIAQFPSAGLTIMQSDAAGREVFKSFDDNRDVELSSPDGEKNDADEQAGGGINTDDDTPTSAGKSTSSGPPIGAIVGGVIGGIAFLVLIGLAIFCFCRRRRASRAGSRSIEKEYEADFDHEIGHDVGMLPHFTKETGYASIPTPPPPPPQMFQPQPYTGYNSGADPLAIQRYSDDSPTQSHSSSPTYVEQPPALPVPAGLVPTPSTHTATSLATPQTSSERRASLTTISTDISPMVSRNVSTVSRRDYPGITQVAHKNNSRSVLPEDDEDDDDDYDVVSVSSGQAYQRVQTSAPSSGGGSGSGSGAPRLPFARMSPDSEREERSGL